MRVLIVEDNKKIAQAIQKGLQQEAFAVDTAFDGQKGFDLAAVESYDLVILDLMLPKMGGMEICRKLREEEKVDTPILMLTAKGELDDKVDGLNCGADDYLTKPFDFEELLARARALIRRPKKITANILKCENLKLDLLNLKAERAGNKISLSKKEFALLEYLMRNKGKILTKQQIIDHVWDFSADVLPNTVEVYIGYLRKKIGKPDLIKTVRGFGYKLENNNADF